MMTRRFGVCRGAFAAFFCVLSGCAALAPVPLPAQTAPLPVQTTGEDPSVFIGFSLRELLEVHGAPEQVRAVRGNETWQDDVVFVYASREFYFYRDRVWQVGVKSAFGINAGDRRDVIPLVMGDGVLAAEDHSLAELPGRAWPMSARFNIDARGMVTGIFVYRSDF